MKNPDAIFADWDFGLTNAQVDEVKDVLLHREEMVKLEHFALQKQAAAVAGERFIKSFGSAGQGQVTLSIMPYLYHKLGRYYGYACWNDNDFLKHVFKHYPETRVKSRSVNPTVSVLADVPTAPRNKKFSKSYGESTPHPGPLPDRGGEGEAFNAVPHATRVVKEVACVE